MTRVDMRDPEKIYHKMAAFSERTWNIVAIFFVGEIF